MVAACPPLCGAITTDDVSIKGFHPGSTVVRGQITYPPTVASDADAEKATQVRGLVRGRERASARAKKRPSTCHNLEEAMFARKCTLPFGLGFLW